MTHGTRRRPSHRLAGRRRRIVCAALLITTSLVAITAPPANATGSTAAALGQQGFPLWYADAAGRRLDLCLDDLNCSSASATLTPFAGGEAAYWAASAVPPGPLTGNGLVLGVHAGFDPTTGTPVTFGRIRIRLKDLAPLEVYTITHPFGQEQLVADPNGEIRRTVDVGCVPPEQPDPVPGEPLPPPPPPVVACDFATALGSKVFDGFLQWDPNVQPAAPAGFLGDALTAHAVVGSPTGTDFFEVVGPGVNARTTEFIVEGRLAAPVATTPVARRFGEQKVATTSSVRTVTVLNTSGASLTLSEPALTGAGAAEFSVVPVPTDVGCGAGVTLATGESCRLGVAFHPATSGFKRAALTLPNSADADNLVASVALDGTGAVPSANVRGRVRFGDIGVGRAATVPVTVVNSGNVELVVSDVRRTGSEEFGLDASACTTAPVEARRSCRFMVTYRPRTVGSDSATLAIFHDGVGSPRRVALTARGVDVSAPAITGLRVRPGRFDPARRGLTVRFGLDGAGTAMLRVTKGDRLVRRLGTVSFRTAGTRAVRWDGRQTNGRMVASGRYTVAVVARDRAGNVSSRSARVVVFRH